MAPPWDEPDEPDLTTGIHDNIAFTPANQGVALFLELVEQWANDGELDAWHATADVETGQDGLDEVTECAMIVYGFPKGDDDDGWCSI